MTALPGALLLVTDRRLSARPLIETVCEAVAAGVKWVWLRDRDLDPTQRRRLAEALRGATAGRCALVVGADAALAAEIGAEGAHLPTGSDVAAARKILGSQALIGVSAHRVEDALEARDAGATYVTLSPIFASASKPGYGPALGLRKLAQAAALGCPTLALGGVTPENAGDCLRAGAAGLAVMGGILSAADPARATAEYVRALDVCGGGAGIG